MRAFVCVCVMWQQDVALTINIAVSDQEAASAAVVDMQVRNARARAAALLSPPPPLLPTRNARDGRSCLLAHERLLLPG